MTEAAFIAAHLVTTGDNINNANNVNVNYDEVVSGTGTITGFTVTTLAEPTSTVVDLFVVLQRATRVTFTLNGALYTLPITSKEQYLRPTPYNSFFYFKVNPSVTFATADLPPGIDVTPVKGVLVSVTPFLTDLEFEYGEYNALIGNATLIRRSKISVESDRGESTTRPTNFDAIISGSATKAEIQDSNYTTTGWIGARYNGTKTTTSTYGGVSPAVTGRSFDGEIYRSGSVTTTICSASLADRVIKPLFFSGNTTFPEYLITTSSLSVFSGVDLAAKVIPVAIVRANSASIDVGTIVKVGQELMRVEATDYSNLTLTVERGYLGTTQVLSSITNEPILRIAPVQIFSADTNATNKTGVIDNSKIWVKETQNILSTDPYGMVFNSEICLL